MASNSNNNSGIEEFNLSDFSNESGEEELASKIKELEDKLAALNNQQANQTGASSMMQMGWQFGEKFGELKKEMEGMKEFGAKNAELKRKIAENNRQMQEMKDEIGKLSQENVKLNEALVGNGRSMDELKKDMTGMLDEIRALKTAIEGGKTEFDGIKEENRKLKEEIGAMKEQMAEKTAVNNISQQFENLSRQIEEKEATNSQTIANLDQRVNELAAPFKLKVIKMDGNKFGTGGPKLAISDGGLVVKHTGPNGNNCVRAQMAFPKFNLNLHKPSIAYFEVEIIEKPDPYSGGITIGFCDQQFPLEGNWLGYVENSIGIWYKEGIYIDGNKTNFGNGFGHFQAGNGIGIGILHFPAISTIKCFATCNGNLLGFADLPQKFAALELFPAVTLCNLNDSVRANFGSEGLLHNLRGIFTNL